MMPVYWFHFSVIINININKKGKTKMNTDDITGKVENVIDLVEYQSGSVVSRTIIDKPAGTMTLFAFDAGQGLSEHTAPFDALVYLLDGNAEVIISGKPLQLKKGEMVIMPANQPHALKAIRKFKMLLVMIKS
jgi:quercetin dioxygenase-like cupin family protein